MSDAFNGGDAVVSAARIYAIIATVSRSSRRKQQGKLLLRCRALKVAIYRRFKHGGNADPSERVLV